MIIYLVTTLHIIVCLILVVVVLLQSGKAADLAGAFGGMGSQTVFGPRGSATVLSKATTISAIAFMFTSLTLSILATRAGSSTPDLLKKIPAAGQNAPAPVPGQSQVPAQAPVQPQAPQGPITVQGGQVGGKPLPPVTLPAPGATPPPATQPQRK